MEKSPNKPIPQIRITGIEKDKNGGDNISFEVDDDFLEYIKKEKNIKNVDQNTLSEFVNELLQKCATGVDGYDYTKLNNEDEQ